MPLGSAEPPEPDAAAEPDAVPEDAGAPPQATMASSMPATRNTLRSFFIEQFSSFFVLFKRERAVRCLLFTFTLQTAYTIYILYQIALQTVSPIKLKKNGEAGHVGCALETVGGVVFTGICIDVPCSIGICAEQAAIAEMLKNRETKIKRIVAVYEDGSILPPCGRCRELMSQLDLYNENTMVVVDFEKEVRLKELLPERWDKKWD